MTTPNNTHIEGETNDYKRMTHEEKAKEIVDELGSPYPKEHSKSVEKILDEAYNMGVEHCIEIMKKFMLQLPGLSEPLAIKLEALKKKP